MPLSPDEPVALPDLVQGTEFVVLFESTDSTVVNFAVSPTNRVALFLDPPLEAPAAAVRLTLVQGDGSSTQWNVAGKSYVQFTRPDTYSAAMVPGRWTVWVTNGPPGAKRTYGQIFLTVVAPNDGVLTPTS